MAHWIFQSTPGTGLTPRRCVKRHRGVIAVGDDVAFWQTRGVGLVALGVITGPAAVADESGWSVPISMLREFADDAVPRAVLAAEPDFAGSAILRMPAAASPFPVTPGEWAVLTRHAPGAAG